MVLVKINFAGSNKEQVHSGARKNSDYKVVYYKR